MLNISYLFLTFSFSRSAAKKNCLRSFPPTIRKSTFLKNELGANAKLGTSNIAPIFTNLGIILFLFFSLFISSKIISFASKYSLGSVTRGITIFKFLPLAPLIKDCTCILNTPVLSNVRRIALHPNVGLGSISGVIVGSILSLPISNVLKNTGFGPAESNTLQ